ncbi:hypothetical protein SBA2_980011 [Acidobacteriia bacterium SbA2]|nr:hypothetical protein SBA2_980011 [Acidobacteriia bacterium SbA2]
MATRSPQPKRPIATDADLAIAAIEGNGRPLDLDAGDPDTSPTALTLPGTPEAGTCRRHQWVCANCGSPLRQNGS